MFSRQVQVATTRTCSPTIVTAIHKLPCTRKISCNTSVSCWNLFQDISLKINGLSKHNNHFIETGMRKLKSWPHLRLFNGISEKSNETVQLTIL